MKKLLFIILVISICINLVGCGGDKSAVSFSAQEVAELDFDKTKVYPEKVIVVGRVLEKIDLTDMGKGVGFILYNSRKQDTSSQKTVYVYLPQAKDSIKFFDSVQINDIIQTYPGDLDLVIFEDKAKGYKVYTDKASKEITVQKSIAEIPSYTADSLTALSSSEMKLLLFTTIKISGTVVKKDDSGGGRADDVNLATKNSDFLVKVFLEQPRVDKIAVGDKITAYGQFYVNDRKEIDINSYMYSDYYFQINYR